MLISDSHAQCRCSARTVCNHAWGRTCYIHSTSRTDCCHEHHRSLLPGDQTAVLCTLLRVPAADLPPTCCAAYHAAESAVCHAVSGKRKRQENFQSRKRQAQTAPPGADVAIETAGVQDATAQPATSMATDDQLDQGVQASAALVMTRLAPKTELSGTTALPHDLSTNTMSLDRQLQQQMQGASSPWRAALANSPADSDHAVPSPIGQPDVQAVGASVNGQVKVQGVEKLAADHSGSKSGPQRCVVAKPVNEARGHTGYLTFARRSVDD